MSEKIPEGWCVRTIADSAKNVTEKFRPDNSQNPKYIGLEHITPTTKKVSNWGYADEVTSTKTQFRSGDTLFGKLRPNLKKVSVADFNGICSTDILAIRAYEGISTEFLYRILSSDSVIAAAVEAAYGNVMPRTSWAHLSSLEYSKPPLPEQLKIATILSSVDNVIEKTRAQIDKLKDLKTGMMQELLTKGIGHTEFKDSPVGRIPVGWDVVSLEKICDLDAPITYGVLKPGQYVENGKPLLQIKDLDSGSILPHDLHLIGEDLDFEYRRSRVQAGDIVISLVGTIGRIAMIPGWLREPNIHRNLGRIRTKYNRLVYHFLQSSMALEQLGLQSSGSSQSALNLSALRQMLLPLPEKEEMKKITECLDSIEKCIALVVQKHSKHITNKKALMQDLLTGKVRVQVDTRELADA